MPQNHHNDDREYQEALEILPEDFTQAEMEEFLRDWSDIRSYREEEDAENDGMDEDFYHDMEQLMSDEIAQEREESGHRETIGEFLERELGYEIDGLESADSVLRDLEILDFASSEEQSGDEEMEDLDISSSDEDSDVDE
ncbi:hypothetical protein ACLMJK_000031 [Lecanora helva]